MGVGGYIHVTAWVSEDNLQESVLSFHHIGSGNQTQVVKFNRKHLYPLSRNVRPLFTLNNEIMDNSFPNRSVIYIHNKELLAKERVDKVLASLA